MRQKKVKALRKAMKEANGFELPIKPDYKIAKTVKKKVTFTDKKDSKTEVECERYMIINAVKLPYQRMKKEFQKNSKK